MQKDALSSLLNFFFFFDWRLCEPAMYIAMSLIDLFSLGCKCCLRKVHASAAVKTERKYEHGPQSGSDRRPRQSHCIFKRQPWQDWALLRKKEKNNNNNNKMGRLMARDDPRKRWLTTCSLTMLHSSFVRPTKSEWADYAVQARCWNPAGKRAHTQLVREHSFTVVSFCWATVDSCWPKEWN